jgi:hypothetical protein
MAQQHSTVPVVLVDGYDYLTSCTAARDQTTDFGGLSGILSGDGESVYYYDPCVRLQGYFGGLAGPNAIPGLAEVGYNLGKFLDGIAATNKGPVDVIAYDSGGLFVRAYLSGMPPLGAIGAGSSWAPVLHPDIRKLIFVGTPNFGVASQLAPLQLIPGSSATHGAYYDNQHIDQMLGQNSGEVLPGSTPIWRLATWNQRGDDLRGVDAIAIAGNGDATNATDGLVSVNSASIAFAAGDGDQRTRVIPYCHGPVMLGSCGGDYLTNVQGQDHPTYQIIRSFLDDTSDWQNIGVSASQASSTGGVIASLGAHAGWLEGCLDGSEYAGNVCGHWPTLGKGMTESQGVMDTSTGYLSTNHTLPTGPPMLYQYAFYWDFNLPGLLALSYNPILSNGTSVQDCLGWFAPRRSAYVNIRPGTYQVVYNVLGYWKNTKPTQIAGFGIIPAAGLPSRKRSVAPGTLISIYGQNLAPGLKAPASSQNPVLQLGGTSVSVVDYFPGTGEIKSTITCPVTYVADNRVDCKLPAAITPGLHQLRVTTSQQDTGTDQVPIMVEQPAQ